MASEVDICNLALNEVGEDQITALTEDPKAVSKAARLCNLVYGDTRDDVLRSAQWNFAIKRAKLSKLTSTPAFEFGNSFQLPTDCLRVIRTDNELSPFRIEGKTLVSNEPIVYIEYIARITDTTQFDSLFIETLAVKIGARLAYNLSDNNTLTQLLEQKYRDRLRLAKTMDGLEGTPRSIEADEWLNSRW